MASTPARCAAIVITAVTTLTALPALAADTPAPAVSVSQQRAQGAQDKRAAARDRASRQRSSLVRVALNQKGDRYVGGASGPNSFDCSGFTMWIYRTATGKYLPHYSGAQMNKARRVGRKHLKPGDLLFFGPGGSQHVSMYIGKGKMIHATNPRSGVRIDSINMGYYRARFAGAGRIVEG
jgi:cell wall-associated NlpC family hydrolase